MDSSMANDRTTFHNHDYANTPRLCSGGCGFYGTEENRGLCSTCYRDYLKQEIIGKSKPIVSQELNQLVSESDPEIKNNVPPQDKVVNLSDHKNSATIIKESDDKISIIKKNRCACCNKKVGSLGFNCRCGDIFCGIHRHPESHVCKFDYKTAGRIALMKQNPVCKRDKIIDRN